MRAKAMAKTMVVPTRLLGPIQTRVNTKAMEKVGGARRMKTRGGVRVVEKVGRVKGTKVMTRGRGRSRGSLATAVKKASALDENLAYTNNITFFL